MLEGLLATLSLSAASITLSTAAGAAIGIASTWRIPYLAPAIRAYVEVFRGLPVIVTLFAVYFVFPSLGLNLGPFAASVIGLSLWASANVSEVTRGAIQSIPKGQWEASLALGLSYFRQLGYVILPQAVRRTVPPMVGLTTNLLQASSLTVLIGTTELLRTAQNIVERVQVMEGRPVAFQVYLAVMIGYFILCYPLSLLGRSIERRK